MRSAEESPELQLNRRWRPALMAFFRRRIHDKSEAEDLTQEVFVRMLNSEAAGNAPDVYIFQIASNLLADRARRASVRRAYRETLLDAPAVDVLDPQRIALGRAELARFASALEELPEPTRTMFTLYRLEHMAQDVIAETFGISVSAVKKHIAKATMRLSAKMQEEA